MCTGRKGRQASWQAQFVVIIYCTYMVAGGDLKIVENLCFKERKREKGKKERGSLWTDSMQIGEGKGRGRKANGS